jgi:hypothetical protein
VKLDSDLFELDTDEGFDFFFDVLDGSVETHSLYFTRKASFHYSEETFLLGLFEFVSGEISNGLFDLIYQAKMREIENFAGYIEEPEDESSLEFSTSFDTNGSHYTNHYLVRDSGHGYALLITMLSGYNDKDLVDIRKVASQVEFRNLSEPAQQGEFLSIKMSSSNYQTKIGNRVLLNSVTG